jgi:hypothetical protein
VLPVRYELNLYINRVRQCLLPPYATQFTFILFILASQHVSAYIEAIFKCDFLSNNTILKKLLLLNGSVDFTMSYSVHYFPSAF